MRRIHERLPDNDDRGETFKDIFKTYEDILKQLLDILGGKSGNKKN